AGQRLACLGVDLPDLALAVLPDPERTLGPGQPRVTPAAGCRDRRQDLAGRRIDLVDAVAGDLEEAPAVEGRPGIGGDVQGAHDPAAAWRTRFHPRRPGRATRGAGSAAGGRGRRSPDRRDV